MFKSGQPTKVIERFKNVQTRLKTLVLTLENFSNNENQQKINKTSKSTNKRESFFRELNQMRNEVITYVNDIQKQLQDIRPSNTNDINYIQKAQNYLLLIQLTTEILTKLNQLFTQIFDRFSEYIEQLWNYMSNHDDVQARRVTREFNQFFLEKTSNSDKLFNDIQQLVNDIDNDERNWREEPTNQ
jgi:hypothetical protein